MNKTKLLIIGSGAVLCLFLSVAYADASPRCWELPNPSQKCIETSKKECENANGWWGGIEHELGHIPGCNPKTSDGGKSCDAPEQCEGVCFRGKCSEHKDAKGCGILIRDKDGKIQNACID